MAFLGNLMTRGGSKFGRSLCLRPLTSKRGNKNFYKGKGHRNEGRFVKKSAFMVQPHKLLTLEVPDLTGFKLKAYVSPLTKKPSLN